RDATVTGVQTCALPICGRLEVSGLTERCDDLLVTRLASFRRRHLQAESQDKRGHRNVSSNSRRIRRYSSVQLSLRVKLCRSAGYIATSQCSFFSSISRCTRRAVSWKFTLSSTIP